jgi:hypothetical protein
MNKWRMSQARKNPGFNENGALREAEDKGLSERK